MTVNKRGKMVDYCLVDDHVQIDDLPENCIYNILVRLPVESLCSLRFVCKTWFGIVKSIDFRNNHHLHRSDPRGIIFLTSVQQYLFVLFMEIKDGTSTVKDYNMTIEGRILATCNGLIVIKTFQGDRLGAEGLILLNPVTRELEDIPMGTFSPNPRHVYGLAFCQASRRYKLLHLFMTEDKFCGEIMDIGSGLWRAVDVPPTEHPPFLDRPVFAMGALHWIQYLDDQGDCVVSMPLDDEKFKTTAIPAEMGGGDHIPCNKVFAMGEFLGLSSCRREANQFGVWILRGSRDECGWEKQYDIDGRGFGYLTTLFYSEGDDQLVLKCVDECLYTYDRHTRHLTKMETTREWNVNNNWTIFPHVNSLISWRS